MKELQDVERRVREHSGLIYRADVQSLIDSARRALESNTKLAAELEIAESRIGELESEIQGLTNSLKVFLDAETSVTDTFEGVVVGEME